MHVVGQHDLPAGARLPDLAVFPLNVVLFPGGLLPLRIFEQRYMDMAKRCLKEDEPFGVCLIRSGHEVGTAAIPEIVGCTARIVEWDMQQLGVLSVKTRGEQRFRILDSRVTDAGLTRATIEMIAQDEDVQVPGVYDGCVRLLKTIVAEHGEKIIVLPPQFESCTWVGARLAEILPIPLAAKQKLLELNDALRRVDILHKLLLKNDDAAC